MTILIPHSMVGILRSAGAYVSRNRVVAFCVVCTLLAAGGIVVLDKALQTQSAPETHMFGTRITKLGASESNHTEPAPPATGAQIAPTPAITLIASFDETSLAPATPLPDIFSAPGPKRYEVSVHKGDTLISMLMRSGATEQEAFLAAQAVKPTFNPKKLREGDKLSLVFASVSPTRDAHSSPDAGMALHSLSISKPNDDNALAEWTADTIAFWESPDPVNAETEDQNALASIAAYAPPPASRPTPAGAVLISGQIQTSLFEAAQTAGLSKRRIAQLSNLFQHQVDFARDLRRGDKFEVLFKRRKNPGGSVSNGPILYASLRNKGRLIELYRSKLSDGRFGYFDSKGRTNKRTLMRTPVSGARISSRFGPRRHPILGYTRMHKGVDFAARVGTPIVAAGNGVIERIGRNGGFGNYIRIRHNGTYETAYAHMKRFRKGLKVGTHVRQGQVIGYVGTTGLSTGPHLHFEVIKNGTRINPLKLKNFGANRLAGAQLKTFRSALAKINTALAGQRKLQFAEAETRAPKTE